jgi:hypothetical protein
VRAHGAQVQTEDAATLVARVRTMPVSAFGAWAISLQAALDGDFDFELFGKILLRATDEELVRLHQKRRRR